MSSTAEIERHAEEVRAEMAGTAQSLQQRLTPGQIIDEMSGYFKDSDGALGLKNLQRQVRDNPMALAVVGAGLAWLMMGSGPAAARPVSNRGFDGGFGGDRRFSGGGAADDYRSGDATLTTADPYLGGEGFATPHADASGNGPSWTSKASDAAGDAADSVRSSASSAAAGVRSGAHNAAAGVRSTASSLRDSGASAYASARHSLSDAAHGVSDATGAAADRIASASRRFGDEGARLAGGARHSINDAMDREPLILGAVGLAVGAAIGALLPRSRVEDEYLGETSDRTREAASEALAQGLHEAEEVVEKTAAATKQAMKDEGLMPKASTLSEKVNRVADAAIGTAESEVSKKSDKLHAEADKQIDKQAGKL